MSDSKPEHVDSKDSAVERRLVNIRLCIGSVVEGVGNKKSFVAILLSVGVNVIVVVKSDGKPDVDNKGSAVE